MAKKVVILKYQLQNMGGLEKYTLRLANRFAEKGCDVTILTSGPVPGQHGSFAVHSISDKKALSMHGLRNFDLAAQQWLNTHSADVIFGMERNSFQTHYRAGNGVHAEYLKKRGSVESWWKRLSFRYNPLHRFLLKQEKKAYEDPKLQVLFTNSRMVAREILDHYAVPPSRIRPIHNGVEWQEMAEDFASSLQCRENTLADLGLPLKPLQLLFAGHEYKRKGLLQLLQALAQIDTPFHLSVVGKDRNIEAFKKAAAMLGLARKVTFFGPQPQIRKFLIAADVVCIPSLYDPFANVTVEALAMGNFVVSSPYNGGSEVLENGTGTVIENLDDLHSICSSLKIAFKHPKTQLHAIRIRNSIAHLEFNNQLDKIIDATLQT